METKEYHSEDKSSWPDGVWKQEPDKIQWPDPATGLPCLIVRAPNGALCGYVGVPDTHPWHGKSYDVLYGHIDVHGGLTFSDSCSLEGSEERHICHVPGPGEPDNVWWFGFDCGHAGDLSPKYMQFDITQRMGWATYRDIDYVRAQVARLAEQLVESGA